MKIIAGHDYLRRDGTVARRLMAELQYPFRDADGHSYTADGKFNFRGPESPFDLVAEFAPIAEAEAAASKAVQEWRFTNRIPHGLLTDAERAELEGWEGPWERYYPTEKSWIRVSNPAWDCHAVYRAVRPTPKPRERVLYLTPDLECVISGAIIGHWRLRIQLDDDGNPIPGPCTLERV